jgi:peroxiredoxin
MEDSLRQIALCAVFAIVAATAALEAADEQKKVENFTLQDFNGVKHSLTDYPKARAIVLMFISTECPVSNGYNARMSALYDDYKDRGIEFLGINSNKAESVEDIRSHAKKNNFQFTILKDPENKIADRLQASVTPEIFVLSSRLELLYQGRIDDNSRGTNITSQDLRKALDEILAGKAVSVSRTKAFGCTIKRVDQ